MKRSHLAALPSAYGTVYYLLKCLAVQREHGGALFMPLPLKCRVATHALFLVLKLYFLESHKPLKFFCQVLKTVIKIWHRSSVNTFLIVKGSNEALHYSECLISLQFFMKSQAPLLLVMPPNTQLELRVTLYSLLSLKVTKTSIRMNRPSPFVP